MFKFILIRISSILIVAVFGQCLCLELCDRSNNKEFLNERDGDTIYYEKCDFDYEVFLLEDLELIYDYDISDSLLNQNVTKVTIKGESEIIYIPSTLFNTFPELLSLNLINQTKLSLLEPSHFINATKLQSLSFWYSNISVLVDNLFVNASNLEYINLISCMIEKIDILAFDGLSKLKELSLKNNKISILDSQTFSSLKSLRYLNLLNNPCINNSYNITKQNFAEIENDLNANSASKSSATIESLKKDIEFSNIGLIVVIFVAIILTVVGAVTIAFIYKQIQLKQMFFSSETTGNKSCGNEQATDKLSQKSW